MKTFTTVPYKSNPTQQNLSPELTEAIVKISVALKHELDKIHSVVPTTKNYYGDYMSIINGFAKSDIKKARFIGLCLLEAGANVFGIESAMQILGFQS